MARNASSAAASIDKTEAEVNDQIGRIRRDITTLANKAGAKTSDALDVSAEKIEELRQQLVHVERQVAGKVRDNPYTALAIAAGLGFVVALLAARR